MSLFLPTSFATLLHILITLFFHVMHDLLRYHSLLPSFLTSTFFPSSLPPYITYSQMGTAIDGLAVTATNYGESQATDLEVH
jgi:hypothetical protein